MMIKIEMTDQKKIKNGISQRTNKEYSIATQIGYVQLPDQKYPVQIEVMIPSNSDGFKPGQYTLNPKSFRVGSFGRLEFGDIHLDSVKV